MNSGERIAYHLPTPCGSIRVLNDSNCLMPFSVRKSSFDTAFEADSGKVYDTTHRYIIALPADRLEAGRIYRIVLEGISLRIGASDECNECVVGSGNGCSIAIGAADPNEPEKYRQYLARRSEDDPPYTIAAEYAFDRSSFVRCDVHILPDRSGFRFERLDDLCGEVVFPVAWIVSQPDAERETEDAVQFWVL